MGIGSFGRAVKERHRQAFVVPAGSGQYASGAITIGRAADAATGPFDYAGVTVLFENNNAAGGVLVSGAQAEIWLPRVQGETDGKSPTNFDLITDYYPSGQVISAVGVANSPTGATASFGSLTYALAGYPGCQIRVKSGGIPGTVYVSVSAF